MEHPRTFMLWMLLLIALIAFVMVLVFSNVEATEVHAVQPDPRIEWVEVDASGLVVCTLGDTLKTAAPLPQGSVLYIPVVVTTPIRSNRKQA